MVSQLYQLPLSGAVRNPTIVTKHSSLTYRGTLQPRMRLVIDAQPALKATLFSLPLVDEPRQDSAAELLLG